MKKFGVLCLVLFMALSCEEKKQRKYLPGSIGGINTIAVVIENDLWEGPVGDKIREHFAAPLVGLPWEEPDRWYTYNRIP